MARSMMSRHARWWKPGSPPSGTGWPGGEQPPGLCPKPGETGEKLSASGARLAHSLAILRPPVALAIALIFAVDAGAAELPGRFTFEKVPEGYLRLDTASGQVSLCSAKAGVWSCTALGDDIARLNAENQQLKERVEELEKSRFTVDLPSDQDVDKMLDLFGKMVDRFLEFSRRIERQGTI